MFELYENQFHTYISFIFSFIIICYLIYLLVLTLNPQLTVFWMPLNPTEFINPKDDIAEAVKKFDRM